LPLAVISLIYKSYYTIFGGLKAELVLKSEQVGRLPFDVDCNETKNSTCGQVLYLNLSDFLFHGKDGNFDGNSTDFYCNVLKFSFRKIAV